MDKEEIKDEIKYEEKSNEKNDIPLIENQINEIKSEEIEKNLLILENENILSSCFICKNEENNLKNCGDCDKAVCNSCLKDSASSFCKNCFEEKIKFDM